MEFYFYLVLLFSGGLATPDIDELTLKPYRRNSFKDCITRKGEKGHCVHYSHCNEQTYKIDEDAIIYEDDLRTFECHKTVELCCAKNSVTIVPPPTREQLEVNCSVTDDPVCPWCVKLYRDGADNRKLKTGFFCMGTMIGSKVVLSTGTCMLQAQNCNMWARVPHSVDPNAVYAVKFRQIHPQYNSGTRENDLALFVLDNDVTWGAIGPGGACLGIMFPLLGNCLAAGVDSNENIYMTHLYVEPGNCGRGSSVDASCGVLQGEYCSVFPGSPVTCRLNDGPYVVVGLAKQRCYSEPPKALIGNFSMASDWLETTFKVTMGLQEKNYLHELIIDF